MKQSVNENNPKRAYSHTFKTEVKINRIYYNEGLRIYNCSFFDSEDNIERTCIFTDAGLTLLPDNPEPIYN